MIRRDSLRVLLNVAYGHDADLVGRLWPGAREANDRVVQKLLARSEPDTPEGRVLLYICPECGDIGCGAYAVRSSRVGEQYVWADFTYENGRDEPRPLVLPKAFGFDQDQYEVALRDAAGTR
jgi:hypothetical protein